mmetsp:Transcript_19968/g.39215  ORF Transcript_19968/g.39215 Transcript_19968/m.39215 type:complete len:299 (+) Transcript_19968:118-1014(+)
MRGLRFLLSAAILAASLVLQTQAEAAPGSPDTLKTDISADTGNDEDPYAGLDLDPRDLDDEDEAGYKEHEGGMGNHRRFGNQNGNDDDEDDEDDYEDVDDVESDFHMDDFSPSHVFTFALERSEECFYERIESAPMKIRMAFFVASGGSQKVDVRVAKVSEGGRGREKSLHAVSGKTEGSYEGVVSEQGEYKFCFANPSGQRKHVTFALHVGVHKREIAKGAEITPLEEALRAAHHDLNDLVAEQNFIVTRVRRHMLTEDAIEWKVSFYTVLESAFMLGVTLGQIFYIQRLIYQRQWV